MDLEGAGAKLKMQVKIYLYIKLSLLNGKKTGGPWPPIAPLMIRHCIYHHVGAVLDLLFIFIVQVFLVFQQS